MPITVGTPTANAEQTTTPYSYNHTTIAGTQLLVVMVINGDNGGKNDTSGVTFNSVAMTLAHQELCPVDYHGASIWYLLNPAIGTYSVTCSNNGSNSSFSYAINVFGIDTSDYAEANNGTSGSGSPSCDVVAGRHSTIIFDAFGTGRTSDLTIGTGQILIHQDTMPHRANSRCGASYIILTAPATYTMYWTGSGDNCEVGAAFNGAEMGGSFILNMI